MSDHWILDENRIAVPADQMTWARFFEDHEKRIVARTQVAEGITVSTVFLGLDHSFGRSVPILFESMVFIAEGEGVVDCDDPPWPEQQRYATWAAAECGHIDLVDEVQRALAAVVR